MGKRKVQPPPPSSGSLNLFTPVLPSSAEAWKTVERYPVDARYYQAKTRCRDACCRLGPSHGPYWFCSFKGPAGKKTSRYIGSQAKYEGIKLAHVVVRRELEQAEVDAGPALAHLRELEERAGVNATKASRRGGRSPGLSPASSRGARSERAEPCRQRQSTR